MYVDIIFSKWVIAAELCELVYWFWRPSTIDGLLRQSRQLVPTDQKISQKPSDPDLSAYSKTVDQKSIVDRYGYKTSWEFIDLPVCSSRSSRRLANQQQIILIRIKYYKISCKFLIHYRSAVFYWQDVSFVLRISLLENKMATRILSLP